MAIDPYDFDFEILKMNNAKLKYKSDASKATAKHNRIFKSRNKRALVETKPEIPSQSKTAKRTAGRISKIVTTEKTPKTNTPEVIDEPSQGFSPNLTASCNEEKSPKKYFSDIISQEGSLSRSDTYQLLQKMEERVHQAAVDQIEAFPVFGNDPITSKADNTVYNGAPGGTKEVSVYL